MNTQEKKHLYIGKNSIGTEQGDSGKVCMCLCVCVSVCVLEYFYKLLKKKKKKPHIFP